MVTSFTPMPLKGVLSRQLTGRFRGVVVLLLAGGVAAMATPGFLATPYLAFVAFIPMFWAFDRVASFSAFTKGYIFGFAYFLANSFWLYNIAYQYGLPASFGVIAYVILFLLAFYYAAIALFYSRVKSPLWVAVFFGVVELGKGIIFTGYPFGNVGVMLYGQLALVQGASFYGEIGLSVLVIMVNLGVYRTLSHPRKRISIAYVVVGFAGLLLPNLYYSPSQYTSLPPETSKLNSTLQDYTVGYATSGTFLGGGTGGDANVDASSSTGNYSVLLVQTGLGQREKWSVRQSREVIDYINAVVREASYLTSLHNPDIVVFPESVYPQNLNGVAEVEEILDTYFPETPVLLGVIYNRAADGVVSDLSTPNINFGTLGTEGDASEVRKSFTSIYTHRSASEKYTIYDKNRLVLFGEYLPLYDLMSPLYGFLYGFDSSDGYSKGDLVGAINISVDGDREGLRILPLLCMEASFSSATTRYDKGSFNVITVMGNDDWFKVDVAKRQHIAVHAMRAIETRKAVLRAGQTGVTTVIHPNGAFETSSTSGVMFSLQKFDVNDDVTVFSRIKYWWLLPLTIIGIALRLRRLF